MAKTLLAIPVYNEERTVGDVVRCVLDQRAPVQSIALIDDGSSDQSPAIIDELARQYAQVTALHHESNKGYGAAMVEAMLAAQADGFEFLITMDCDLQHRPDDIARFVAEDESFDIVSGSRYMPDSARWGNAPEDRVEINARITRKLNRLYGWNLTDSFCGFKRYKMSAIHNPAALFDMKGYAFPLQFWAWAASTRCKIKEIAVSRIYVTDDRSFGEDLDRRRKRYRYYLETLRRARQRFEAY